MSTTINSHRINSIDILRGFVMVLMALDHVRDYFHIGANTHDPLDLQTTTPFLYFTRWITHFCAPVFVFLSGTSIYLQSLRKSKSELSEFLIKRGLWLILVEVIVVSFGWSFNPFYKYHFMQVIWAIGISMFILGFCVRLPFKVNLVLGIMIVFGHNLLDIPESAEGFKAGFLWDLFHHGTFVRYPYSENHSLMLVYPFLPWTGVMMLGYCVGWFFRPEMSTEKRKKALFITGGTSILFFVALRLVNGYGDSGHWSSQKNIFYTILSFIDVSKYPPSLLFICMTIGPALLLLPLLERVQNKMTDMLRIFGRVAFFYYVLHIYLIHFLSMLTYFARSHGFTAEAGTGKFPFLFVVPGEGYGLPVVYLVWIGIIAILYPICRRYNGYKGRNKEKWWVSYI